MKAARLPSLILFLILALLTLGNCGRRHDWVMFRGEQGRGSTPNAVLPPLGIRWKLKLQEGGPPAYAFNNPAVMEDTIYFGSTDGNFYALDIESGYMRWVFKTAGAVNSVPFADADNVYFGSNDGKLYAVSRKNGREAWSLQTGSTIQSSIVGYRDHLIFAADGDAFYFLNRQGVQRHLLPNPVWHYNTFQVFEDVLYFAPGPLSQPHSFGAYDIRNQAYLWILDTSAMEASWYSFPALRRNSLFFSTCTFGGDFLLFTFCAFDRRTGELQWKKEEESDWGLSFPPEGDVQTLFESSMKLLDYLAPSLWRNLVIYAAGDAVVRAFDARNGNIHWTHRFDALTSSAPTVAGDRVYLGVKGREDGGGSNNPKLACLAAANGRLLWEMEIEGALLSAPVIAGKWLIFGTDRNVFYVLEELYGS